MVVPISNVRSRVHGLVPLIANGTNSAAGRCALLAALASAVGFLSWHGSVAMLAFAPAIVIVWRAARSRMQAFIFLYAYYLAASRGLLLGAGIFFGDSLTGPAWAYGLGIWLVPNAILAATWALCWGRSLRIARISVALLLTSLPPIGVVGWANPLTAAGAIFPGLSWLGMALTMCLLAMLAHRLRPVLASGLIALAIAANTAYVPTDPPGWVSIDTTVGTDRDAESEYSRLQTVQHQVMSQIRAHPEAKVFVLPELVGGNWDANAIWWEDIGEQLNARGQTALIGAYLPYARNHRYVNALFSIGRDPDWALVDRVPVPISMWRPWDSQSATAFWWESGVTSIAGIRAASLVCYEQLLIWPIAVSMANRPEIIVGASNVWWARGTSIPAIQHQAVSAWARLLNIPSVWAKNE